jgi:hypothetical protein
MSTTKHWLNGEDALCGLYKPSISVVTNDPERIDCGECRVRFAQRYPPNKRCVLCLRPQRDGGHAHADNECEEPGDAECRLIVAYRKLDFAECAIDAMTANARACGAWCPVCHEPVYARVLTSRCQHAPDCALDAWERNR